jgi:putative addiction module killer protein
MVEIREADQFSGWLASVPDPTARGRILVRIRRLSLGNPGDVRPVGGGVSELRIDYGPGYRVYFIRRGSTVAVLLAGGTKRSQAADIKAARGLAKALEGNG